MGNFISTASLKFSLSIAISSAWSSPLALYIEIYTASHGFPATARLLPQFFSTKCVSWSTILVFVVWMPPKCYNIMGLGSGPWLRQLWKLSTYITTFTADVVYETTTSCYCQRNIVDWNERSYLVVCNKTFPCLSGQSSRYDKNIRRRQSYEIDVHQRSHPNLSTRGVARIVWGYNFFWAV